MIRLFRSPSRALAKRTTRRQFHATFVELEPRLALSGVFPVALKTDNVNYEPFVAKRSDGDSVVTWSSGLDVYYEILQPGQIPNPDNGINLTNNGSSGTTSAPNGLAVNQNDEFVIGYTNLNTTTNYAANGRFFQRFSPSGTSEGSLGELTSLNASLHNVQQYALDNKDDVVAITQAPPKQPLGYADYAQEFDSSNNTAGPFQVTPGSGDPRESLSMDQQTGQFVITYDFSPDQISPDTIFADIFQPFATKGNLISFGPNGGESNVSMNDSGNFVVTWLGPPTSVLEQEFDINGNALTSVETIAAAASGEGFAYPSVAMNDSGKVLTAWLDYTTATNGYYLYAAQGTSPGFEVDTYGVTNSPSSATSPSVSVGADGSEVIVWNRATQPNPGLYTVYY